MINWIQQIFPLMQPILTKTPPTTTEWIHQIKYDGIRLVTMVNASEVRLYTRNQNLRNQQYPELLQISKHVQSKSFILDGEVIVRSFGKPSFAKVLRRDRSDQPNKISELVQTDPIEYQVFDLLMKDGEDLRALPLVQRMEQLHSLVRPNEWLQLVKSEENGQQLLEKMREKQGEGIVSKDLHARYIGGKKHRAWYKTKIKQQQLCVVAGLQYKQGFPNSLVLGVYVANRLQFIGKVASGLSSADIRLLHTYLPQLEQSRSPFQSAIPQPLPIRWLKPQITVLVEYTELTDDGILRQPKLVGFTTQDPEQARWNT